ncbi:MAG: hypothetical protein KC457_29180 [Myxococcales bacterium]|nr:hypothetical protein [Myxococcales bacterium]
MTRLPALLLPVALPVALLLLTSACGPKGKVQIPEGADKQWSQMDESERMQHMSAVVLPRMRTVFQDHDPKRFADFDCATCHGSGANHGDFTMPNPELPQLHSAHFYKQERKQHGDMVRLMWQQVEPTMGEALGVTYSFGGTIDCAACHVEIED